MFQKEEMKQFAKSDTSVLKQHYEKKLNELEQEKKAFQVFTSLPCWHYALFFFPDTLVTLFLFVERNRESSPCINQYIFFYGWQCSKTERKLSSEAECTWIPGLYIQLNACCIAFLINTNNTPFAGPWAQEKAGSSTTAFKAETEKWRGSKTFTRRYSAYKISEGVFSSKCFWMWFKFFSWHIFLSFYVGSTSTKDQARIWTV